MECVKEEKKRLQNSAEELVKVSYASEGNSQQEGQVKSQNTHRHNLNG